MTEKNNFGDRDLEAFGQVLECYGSDRTRWPAPLRKRFASVVSTNAAAAERLREAEALDRLLDMAPPPAIDTNALAGRIMAAAAGAEARPGVGSAARPKWRPALARSRLVASGRTHGPAAALLAASLVLGMFSGLSGTFDAAVQTQTADAAASAGVDFNQIALDNNAVSFFEEDYL